MIYPRTKPIEYSFTLTVFLFHKILQKINIYLRKILFGILCKDKGSIMTAEPKTITHCSIYLHRAGNIRHVIQITFRVGEFKIDRGGSNLIINSKNTYNRFNST